MHRILKYFFILASCLLLPASAFAQSTLVNGTVTDPNGIPYSGATLKAVLVVTGGGVAPGSPTVTVSSQAQCTAAGAGTAPCQIPIQGTFTTTLDASGKIPGGGITLYDNSLVTPAGTQWFFTITITGIAPPLGNGPQTFSVLITISGAAQNIGATLTAAAPKLTNFGGGSSLISGSVTPTHLTFASGVDTIGDVLGSAVTAGTGAATLTASGDAVTPVTLFGHSATQSVPVFNAFNNTTAALRGTFNFLGQGQGAFPFQNISGGLFPTIPATVFVSSPNKSASPYLNSAVQYAQGVDGDANDFFYIYTFNDLSSLNHGTQFVVTNDAGTTNDFMEFIDNPSGRGFFLSLEDNIGGSGHELTNLILSSTPSNNTATLSVSGTNSPSITLDSATGHITNVGALTSTATADNVTPVTLIAHSATQSVPMQIFDVNGSGGNANLLRFKDSTAGGSPQGNIDFAPGVLTVSGSNTAGTAFGSFVVDSTANLELTSTNLITWENNVSFAFNGGINTSTGEIMAGYVPTTQAGFFSIVDGPRTHKISITNPGTVAANYNFALPITAGSAGQPLISEAGGTTPMQWGAISGTGSFCLTTSCVMTTPNLGTPSAATLTNATGLPFSGIASGTNATAAMVVGTGASLGTSGTGTINATTLGGVTFPVPIGSTTCGTCPILNPTINVDQGMIQLSLGTGYLNLATKPFSIEAAGNYTTTAASAPALNFEVQLCTISLCGSGTVVDLIDITTTTLSATALSNATWTISATCVINATGATGNLVCKGSPGLTLDTGASIVTPDSTFADTNSVVSGNIDLTAALFLRFTVAQSVAGASNSYTQTLASIR